MSINIASVGIENELCNRLLGARQRVETIYNVHLDQLGLGEAVDRAHELAGKLAGGSGKDAGLSCAIGILETMIGDWEQADADMWDTPLGRALAWWTGAPQVTATQRRGIAGLVMDSSRQYVHKLFGPGDLAADTLARELQRRYPNPIKEVPSADK
jgi:hypothetical protein